MSRAVPAQTASFLKSAEDCKLTAYADSGGVYTIGVGHTGPDIKAGLTITQEQADAYLNQDIQVAVERLCGRVDEPVIDALTDNQYAALISFVFNLGADPKWTIWKVLNAKHFDQVSAQMARFVYAGGQKLQGLVNRRNAEIALWSTADPGSTSVELSSGVTRTIETPPAPTPPKPFSVASITTKVVSVTAAVGATATQVNSIVQPHASEVPMLAKIAAGLTMVVVACGVIALLISHQQQKASTQ